MGKKLIMLIVICAFTVQATGTSYALRPMAVGGEDVLAGKMAEELATPREITAPPSSTSVIHLGNIDYFIQRNYQREILTSCPKPEIREVNVDDFLGNGRKKVGIVLHSWDEMVLGLKKNQIDPKAASMDIIYFYPLSENVVVSENGLAIYEGIVPTQNGQFIIMRFNRPLYLNKVLYLGWDDSFSELLEGLGYGRASFHNPVNSKLHNKAIFQKAGVSTPEYIVLDAGMTSDAIRTHLISFIDRHGKEGFVLKPEDGIAGDHVEMFLASDINRAATYAETLFIRDHKKLIVEKRVYSYPYYDPVYNNGERLDWNIRALAVWADGTLYLSPDQMEVRRGKFELRQKAINVMKGASPATLSDVLDKMDFTQEEKDTLYASIIDSMRRVAEKMGVRHVLIGGDFILGEDKTLLSGLELNASGVGGHATLMNLHKGDLVKQLAVVEPLYRLIESMPEKKQKSTRPAERYISEVDDFVILLDYAGALWRYGKEHEDVAKILQAKAFSKQVIDLFMKRTFFDNFTFKNATTLFHTIVEWESEHPQLFRSHLIRDKEVRDRISAAA